MKQKLLFLLLCCSIACIAQQNTNAWLKKADKGFIKNYGQVVDQEGKPNDAVRYLLNTKGLNVQLRSSGFSYDVYERKTLPASFNWLGYTGNLFKPRNQFELRDSIQTSLSFHRVDIDFLDTSTDLKIQEYEPVRSYYNYYNVPDCEEGITHVPFYKRILYKNLYKGIDLEFIIPEDQSKPVEYNFKVQPGSNLADIKMRVEGAPVTLKNNRLELSLAQGILQETIPKSWIQEEEAQQEVQVNYTQLAANTFGFEVANAFNYKKPLIIDPTPVRQWATYFGGENGDSHELGGVKINSNGAVVIGGATQSKNFIATSNSHQTNFTGVNSGFLAKFSPEGALIWSTYYGNETHIWNLTIDAQDNIIAVGMTYNSNGIATPNSHQENIYNAPNNFMDAFIVKFDKDCNRIWGSYYGGETQDQLIDVVTDNNNTIYAVGTTSSNFGIATPGAFRNSGMLTQHNNFDPFVIKFSKNGVREWGTYYGGDSGNAIDIDSKGNVYIIGEANGSAEFEHIVTQGAFQEIHADLTNSFTDVFLAKLDSNGSRIWGTFFGGKLYDDGNDVEVDKDDNVIICGTTTGNELNTSQAFQPHSGGNYDAFLAKFDPDGKVIWNTYYGGAGVETGIALAVSPDNSIFFTGTTGSLSDLATPDAFQTTINLQGAYIVKFEPNGNRIWCTYYSGDSYDKPLAIDTSEDGTIYLMGDSNGSQDLATSGSYQENMRGYHDNFLVKFKDCESSITATATPYLCAGEDIEFTASGGTSYTWSGPNGFSSTLQNPVIITATPVQSGTYSVFVTGDAGCDDTRTFEVVVSAQPVANPVIPIEACEDSFNTGISTAINTAAVQDQILGGQVNKVVKYFYETGTELPSPLPNPFTNTTPGKQTITARVYNVDNPQCYAETSFELIVNPLPKINTLNPIITCDEDTDGRALFDISTLKNDLIGNQPNLDLELFYENGQQVAMPLPATLVNQKPNAENLTVRVTNTVTGCSTETSVQLVVNPLPVANPLLDLIGCDDNNDGVSEYFDTSQIETLVLNGQTGMEVSYYDTSGNALPSPLPNPYTNTTANTETLTVRVTNSQTGCYAETPLTLLTAAQPQINQPAPRFACDAGNGYSSFDLTDLEQELIGTQTGLRITYTDANGTEQLGPLSADFQNTTAWSQRINIRVENANNSLCFSETYVDLEVNALPELLIEDTFVICDNEPGLALNRTETFDSWEWEDPSGTIISTTAEVYLTQEGTYTLSVGELQNGVLCTNSYTFSLERSQPPTITKVDFADWSDNNFIEISTTGDGEFEYSLDGSTWQDSRRFDYIKGGVYEVRVRDKAGCGFASEEVILVDYMKVFTPNGDGFNDYWQIEGSEAFPDAKIYIFNRYGKLLKELSPQETGWDGSFADQNLPSDDYWFHVDLGDGRVYKNHFTLKR